MKYVDVILPLPLEGLFTYSLPDVFQGRVVFGMRVLVPLGKSKKYTGLVVKIHDEKPAFKVRDIVSVPDQEPMILPKQYDFWQWISEYYMSPIGDVYKASLPAGLKQEEGYRPKTETYVTLTPQYRQEQALHLAIDSLKRAAKQQNMLLAFLQLSGVDSCGDEIALSRDELLNYSHGNAAILKALCDRGILHTYQQEVGRLNHGGEPHPERINALSIIQQDAYNKILVQFMSKNVILLHGVTSSGKTEVYIHLIQKTIDEGRQVLFLLPEIALTVQMTERLQRVFGCRIGIYHSKYSDAERVEIWQKQMSQSPYDIILGARSACLLPFQRLGLVIVDEEHETSFKQQDPAPRYNARDAAVVLAAMHKAKTLLGTATPSAESWHNAQTGKYGYVQMMQRYQGIELPEIQVVDTKDLQRRKMMTGPFSPVLLTAVREALERGEQVILFLNRRGFAPMVECHTCGWVPRCKNCDVPLVLHRNENLMTCHYCGATYAVPTQCPSCEERNLRGRGYGTERIEEYISQLFPEARTARMDLDTTRTRAAYERMINDFSHGRTNLLIGTQMVTKGLDFKKVSVVGIVNADAILNYPDFRAYEHAFMMMAQVSGRAGRQGRRGRVILQTKSPDLPVIRQVVANDYRSFYRGLLDERRTFHYPPFYHLVYVYMKHRQESTVESASLEFGSRLREVFGSRVLGPDKPSVSRVKQLNIRKIVLKLEKGISLQKVRDCLRTIQTAMLKDSRYGAIQMYYDVDPL